MDFPQEISNTRVSRNGTITSPSEEYRSFQDVIDTVPLGLTMLHDHKMALVDAIDETKISITIRNNNTIDPQSKTIRYDKDSMTIDVTTKKGNEIIETIRYDCFSKNNKFLNFPSIIADLQSIIIADGIANPDF